VHLAGRGVPTGGIFIPRRCSHSASEVVDVRDIERTVDILRELVTVDAAAVAELGRRPTFPSA
jgi:putative aminopeptidase FrvX